MTGIHETGWISTGIAHRRHAVLCNTCGATSEYHPDLELIRELAEAHAQLSRADLTIDTFTQAYEHARDLLAQIERDVHATQPISPALAEDMRRVRRVLIAPAGDDL